MSAYHQKYMGEPGPTDVLSFPMDELRPPDEDEETAGGAAGRHRALPGRHRRAGPLSTVGRPRPRRSTCWSTACCTCSVTTTPTTQEQAEMFGLKDDLLAAWATERAQRSARGTRVR